VRCDLHRQILPERVSEVVGAFNFVVVAQVKEAKVFAKLERFDKRQRELACEREGKIEDVYHKNGYCTLSKRHVTTIMLKQRKLLPNTSRAMKSTTEAPLKYH